MKRKRPRNLSTAMKYAWDIHQGKIPSSEWTKLAIERQFDDLERVENIGKREIVDCRG